MDARETPTLRAMLAAPKPCDFSSMISDRFRCAVGVRPRYFPAAFALAIPSACRTNISSRSNCAIAPNIVTRRRPDGERVSTSPPPKSRTLRPTPFCSSPETMQRRSAVDRASRSSRVTTSVSPSRTKSSAASIARRGWSVKCSGLVQPVAGDWLVFGLPHNLKSLKLNGRFLASLQRKWRITGNGSSLEGFSRAAVDS